MTQPIVSRQSNVDNLVNLMSSAMRNPESVVYLKSEDLLHVIDALVKQQVDHMKPIVICENQQTKPIDFSMPYLTTEEAVRILGSSKSSLHRMVTEYKTLNRYKMCGHTVFRTDEVLSQFIAENPKHKSITQQDLIAQQNISYNINYAK